MRPHFYSAFIYTAYFIGRFFLSSPAQFVKVPLTCELHLFQSSCGGGVLLQIQIVILSRYFQHGVESLCFLPDDFLGTMSN